jgi:hypothetical protein
MNHKCPRCGLFSPAEALRCDCGYDFESRTVQPSYLEAHVVQKHGGVANVLELSARTNIRNGLLLLGSGAAISVVGYVAGGGPSFVVGGVMLWGGVLFYRGLRQRRIRKELLRQPTAQVRQNQ